MEKDRFYVQEQFALEMKDEAWLNAILFYRYANEIYSHFDEWKEEKRFYFIKLKIRTIDFAREGEFHVQRPGLPWLIRQERLGI